MRERFEDELAWAFAAIASEAGAAIMQVYGGEIAVRAKEDTSPVTQADDLAEQIILGRLAERLPHVPVLSEEAAGRGERPASSDRFLLVDPLDGTKEFINRNGEFTVNIACIEQGQVKAGCVYAPALQRVWLGGTRAFAGRMVPGQSLGDMQPIITRAYPPEGLTAVASRSHADEATQAFLDRLRIMNRQSAGSSLKFCLVAEGRADVYPRFGPTMEWDTAAGHAVLQAAGGVVLTPDGMPFVYGKEQAGYRNGAFVAWGRERLA